ncbi:MAG: hypothetical protein J6B27_05610 [Alistipes sp.]|nr:hypothetical protein [Alistipes sp.]MBQ2702322.1 hypothetical protein [Alistipes sp.]
MKTNRKKCVAKCEYLLPDVEIIEVFTECGFADSAEDVDKDEELDVF